MIRSGPFGFLPGPLDEKARRTFFGDCLRQFFTGLIDTGPRTFFLLIAVQRFGAEDLFKTLISIPGSAAMTLSVILLPLLARSRLRKTTSLALARALSGAFYLLAAWHPSLEAYAFWIFLGGLPASIAYPLLTAVYHESYPRRVRGRLFAWASMVNMGSGALFSFVLAYLLGPASENFRTVISVIGVASLLAAWSTLLMPAGPRPGISRRSFIHAFAWIGRDRAFAYMLLVWFVLGFAIFMVAPLKVLFLTEARYGMLYPAATVALIIGVLPEVFRAATTFLWAGLFDRYHFVVIRIALNVLMLASLLAFFVGQSWEWLLVSAALEGIAGGGANIAWSLWVTRMAPAGHTAEYMSVNMFFTGIRGVLGTVLGIHLATAYGIQHVAWASIGLMALSIAMMVPVRNDSQWLRGEGGGGEPSA